MKPALYLAILFAVFPFGGWKTYHLTNDPSVPSAQGNLEARRDKSNGNTDLRLKVEHLADPSRLTPPASVYVVWVQARDGQPQKQGAIMVDKHFSGGMNATTTVRDGDFFITAEQSQTVTEPSGLQILHAHFSV